MRKYFVGMFNGTLPIRNEVRRALQSGDFVLLLLVWTLPDAEKQVEREPATQVMQGGTDGCWRLRVSNPRGLAQSRVSASPTRTGTLQSVQPNAASAALRRCQHASAEAADNEAKAARQRSRPLQRHDRRKSSAGPACATVWDHEASFV